MEESLSLSNRIRELFALKEVDMKSYSPLTLAYIGDAAYELVIRTMVVEKGNRQANQLHKITSLSSESSTSLFTVPMITSNLSAF